MALYMRIDEGTKTTVYRGKCGRTQYPVLYEDGSVGLDFPEFLTLRQREIVWRRLNRIRKLGTGRMTIGKFVKIG